jgi:uncharacterized protein YydD (DUF2326 family)|tara:strand:- start:14 stop:370 length:357 start_codon:yes stop_codon:yes gene_type:complete
MAQGNFSRARIEAYLGRRFTRDEIIISNNGQPNSLNYISYWSSDLEKSEPTEDQLIALKTQGDLIVTNNQRSNKRRNEYPLIAEQLDKLYHDMTAGKLDATGEWHKAIKAVKDANPKG